MVNNIRYKFPLTLLISAIMLTSSINAGKIVNKTLNNLVVLNNMTANNASVSNNLNVGKNLDVAVNINTQNINAKGTINTRDANISGNVHVSGNIDGNFKGDVHGNVYGNVYGSTISTGNIILNDTPTVIKQKDADQSGEKTKSGDTKDDSNLLSANITGTNNQQEKSATGTITPALTFQGDLTTGIYHPAPGNISLVTNGVERVIADQDGNVTITGHLISDAPVSVGNTIISSNSISTGNSSMTSNAISTGNSVMTTSGVSTGRIILADENEEFRSTAKTAKETNLLDTNLTSQDLQDTTKAVIHPSLTFSSDLTTGIYRPRGDGFAFATDGVKRLQLTQAGKVAITDFGTTQGVVHNDASGFLENSLVTDSDIATNAAISDTKLATISTTGKVANSATTATELNTTDAIVKRDASGNFEANNIKVNEVELESIKKNGTTVAWPTNAGAAGQFLGLDATATKLQYSTPAGSGNVSTSTSGFTKTNSLITTDTTVGATYIKETGITIDSNNNISGAKTVELDGIKNSGNTVAWPTGTGFTGEVLAVVAPGQLGYTTSVGSGNVSTPTNFTSNNKILKTSATPSKTIIESGINITDNDDVSGINMLTIKGPLNFPAGWPGVPSMTFTNDVTTGIYNPTGGEVAITTDGTDKLTVNSAGNVSIKQFGSTGGIIHNNPAGYLTNSLIVDGDITPSTITAASIANNTITNTQIATNAAIADTKLATISTSGKVSNSATTANSATGLNTIVARDGSGNFSAGTITANLIGNVDGSASTFTGLLVGDITGTQGNTVVSFVGGPGSTGVSQSQIISGVNAANAATNANTGNKIVLRDASGNFEAGTITADLVGTVSGNVYGNLHGIADNATTAVSFSGPVGASGGDITGLQGNMTVNNVGGQTASYIATGAQLANTATADNTFSTLVRRDAEGAFSAGIITADLLGNVTGNLFGNADTATYATTAGSTPILTGSFGASGGDITGSQTLLTVNSVGNKTTAQVVQATDLALSATSNEVADTIVKRDASGNFTANMISLNTNAISGPNDVTTKQYVDAAVAGGLAPKTPAQVVSTTNSALTGFYAIDSVTLVDGDRVLLTGQTNQVNNGLWVAHSDAWTRPTDFATGTEAMGAYVLILSGAINAGTSWLCDTPFTVIGTNPVNFVQFSLPDQTTGTNVGSGAGQIYKDKTGITLNFKTLAALGNIVLTNNTNDVSINTDATPNNTASTIIARDANGYFTATGMTGAASANVLKAGDTMTGNLLMANESAIRLGASGSNYIGLKSPALVGTSYTIELPNTAPVANQVLQATSATGTTWTTLSPAPGATQNYYVSLAGDDSNNGALSAPFRTVKAAVNAANNLPASLTTPVAINVGPGIYSEDNSGGGIQITVDGVSIIGSSLASTIISPKYVTASNDLFVITKPNVEFYDLILRATIADPLISAIKLNTSTPGNARFSSVGIDGFKYGFNLNSSSSPASQLALFDNIQCLNNGTCINITNNVNAVIKSSVFQGSSTGTPANTFLTSTGANAQIDIIGCGLKYFDTVLTAVGGTVRVSASNIENSKYGIMCENGCQCYITSLNSILNHDGFINVSAKNSGTIAYVEGSMFDCKATSGMVTGTAIKCTDSAVINISSTTVEGASVGLYVDGPIATAINSNGVNLIHCPTDIMQRGTATLNFVGGTIESSVVDFQDPTNISLAAFNSNGETTLSFGNTTDNPQMIYNLQNGQPILPNLIYEPNYYGSKGTVYKNSNTGANASPTFNGVQADNSDASYYVVTGKNDKKASIKLISDTTTATIGSGDNVRGWEISKLGTGADLSFEYSNNDTSGQAARGQNPVMRLNGFDNQIEFPVATVSPTGTNPIAKLVWAPGVDTSTNLYRDVADSLKTDASFSVGGTLTIPGGTAELPSLVVGGDNRTGIYSLDGSVGVTIMGENRLNINNEGTVSIRQFGNTGGVVHNDPLGCLTNSLIVDADITANTITAASIANETITNTQIATGAAIADTKLATISTAGKVSNSATTATNLNTTGAIVARDASGNFSAGTITANLTGNVVGSASLNVLKTGDSMSGDLNMGTNNITGVGILNATTGNLTTGNITTLNANAINATGITMTGDINMGSNNITGAGILNASTGNITTINTNAINATGITMTGNIAMGGKDITNAGTISATTINASGVNLNGDVNMQGNNITGANQITATTFNGALIGNVTGAASLNVLKTGDTMTGPLTVPTVYGNLVGNVTGATTINATTITATNITGNLTGNVTGAASLNVLKAGDTMTGALTVPTVYTHVVGSLTGNVAGSSSENVLKSGDTMTGNLTVPTVYGNLFGNVTGSASENVLKSGDTMTGNLTVPTVYGNLTGNVTGNVSGSSKTFTDPLDGDVTGTQGATVVSFVGGPGSTGVNQTQIISGVNAANAATDANQQGTIVKRNAQGDFAAGTITATLTGAASLNVLKAGDTMSGSLNMGTNNITGIGLLTTTTANITTANVTTLNATNLNVTGVTMTGNLNMSGNNITGVNFLNANTVTANLIGNVTGAASDNLLLAGGAMSGPLTLQQAGFSRSSSTITLADQDYLDLTAAPASTNDIIHISGNGIPTNAILARTANTYPVGTIKILHNVDTAGYIAFYSRVQTALSFMLGDSTAAAGILAGHSKMIMCVSSGTGATEGTWSALN